VSKDCNLLAKAGRVTNSNQLVRTVVLEIVSMLRLIILLYFRIYLSMFQLFILVFAIILRCLVSGYGALVVRLG
jgi:hypothetical protein